MQQSALKGFLFMTDPKRWSELYAPKQDVEEEGVPMTDDDIPDIMDFFDRLQKDQSMNGAAISTQGPEDGWH